MTATVHHTTDSTTPEGRRAFLGTLAGICVVWLGALTYPVYRYLAPGKATDPFGPTGKAKVDKITPSDVANPGQGKNGGYAGRGLVVLRDGDGQLRAFDAKCSHAGCNVAFAGSRIECPCHGGVYDLRGKNISGPPPKPLQELTVFEEQGSLYVGRPSGAKKA